MWTAGMTIIQFHMIVNKWEKIWNAMVTAVLPKNVTILVVPDVAAVLIVGIICWKKLSVRKEIERGQKQSKNGSGPDFLFGTSGWILNSCGPKLARSAINISEFWTQLLNCKVTKKINPFKDRTIFGPFHGWRSSWSLSKLHFLSIIKWMKNGWILICDKF